MLAVLRAALTPTGPFITIPKLGKAFHIRYRSDLDYNGIEIITAMSWCGCGTIQAAVRPSPKS